MEGVVLQTMDFRINAPTAYTFLCLLKQHVGLTPRVAALAVYLLVSQAFPCTAWLDHEEPVGMMTILHKPTYW